MTDYTFKSNFTTKIDFRQAKTPKTNSLTVVYIHGLYSDCWGRKPENVMEWCAANGVNFFRFELAGHGSDSARYEETDVNIWKENPYTCSGFSTRASRLAWSVSNQASMVSSRDHSSGFTFSVTWGKSVPHSIRSGA